MSGLLPVLDAGIETLILVYFLLLNTFYFLFSILSLAGILRYRRLITFVRFGEIFRMPIVKPVSVIVPAFNEGQGIIESVRSLLALRYPVFEVIVVNDGSTDDTLARLAEAFDLKLWRAVYRKSLSSAPVRGIYRSAVQPKLVVVDKVNGGGKADALNAGLNVSRYPLFCAVDADSILESDALLKVVRPFIEDPERTIGAGGIIRLSNGCAVREGQVVRVGIPRNWIARFQVLEYLRAFLGGRLGMAMLRSTLIISGAFGIFRKDIAIACGGYRAASITEDMDLVVRMQKLMHEKKRPFRIPFIPDPICWTEAPESLRVLARQRGRWHRGLIQTLVEYRRMLFRPRYGAAGLFAMPFYALFELTGPFIECLGYALFASHVLLGQANYPFAVAFFFVAVFYGTFVSLLSILLEELSEHRYPRLRDILILTVSGVAENLFYRQYLSVVRAWSLIDYLRGKNEWGAMEKRGFAKAGRTP
ncbi:MAG TPA: glycosyltransferase family 2 protein [Candidatus Aminicenantes bacterium]|nr:glycosyltransferase family 2 protein [Candidatus Aminicenantes bacterium]